MKIAIPIKSKKVMLNFSEAKQIKLYDILDDKIDSSRVIDIDEDTYIGICKILHLEKVDLLLVSRINEPAKDLLEFLKINVLSGCVGDEGVVLKNFLRNKHLILEEYNNSKDKLINSSCDDYCS
jgi:predicted Fe-Mo cluster-binding NifX family protein